MLETKSNVERAVKGIDQQDFDEFQTVKGSYPYQIGLQQRFAGKTIQRVLDGPIGSIYVFYMVYGRTYTILDFGSIQIDEIIEPSYEPPVPPPTSKEWTDDFSGYPSGLVSKFWGAGAWLYTVGICQTIIDGAIDPFLMAFQNFPPPGVNLPVPGVPGDSGNIGAPAPGNIHIDFPLDPPDIVIILRLAQADYSCTGGGTNTANVSDSVDVYTNGAVVDTINVNQIAVKASLIVNGVKIGRGTDINYGIVRNGFPVGHPSQCGGAPAPVAIKYFINSINGAFGVQS